MKPKAGGGEMILSQPASQLSHRLIIVKMIKMKIVPARQEIRRRIFNHFKHFLLSAACQKSWIITEKLSVKNKNKKPPQLQNKQKNKQ